MTFWSDFRRFFLRGLAGLMPPLVTVAIFVWVFNFAHGTIGAWATNTMLTLMSAGGRQPAFVTEADALTFGEPVDEFRDQKRLTREFLLLKNEGAPAELKARIWWELAARKYHLDLVGLVLGILLIYFVGYLLASIMGRSIWKLVESGFFRIPIVKAVYPHVKQVTDLLLSERQPTGSAVVAVEFPRRDAWVLGLAVGDGFEPLKSKVGPDLVRVFVMNSPTPFGGFVIVVPRKDCIEVPLSIDEALRFCVSCGVVSPGASRPPELASAAPWRPEPEKIP